MDLRSTHSAYLIGIKGVGMTALAQILHARGVRVSGSDIAQHFFTDDVLRRAGIPFVEGFLAEHVPDADLVIRSTAYADDHVEVAEARRRGLAVTTYPEAVAMVFNAGRGIAICGTHGKTTTTAMLGWVLKSAGLEPTVLVGSEVPQFGGNALVGSGEVMVLEADEYQDKLQYYQPFGVILTNIEYDHPDFFPSFDAYVDAFRRFVQKIPADGFLVACADDPVVVEVARGTRATVIWYGLTHPPAPPLPQGGGETEKGVLASKVSGETTHFFPSLGGGEREGVGGISLQLPGRHNVQNALAVLAVTDRFGVPRDVALRALAEFQGTRRRFEVVGEVGDVTIIDDYGHHPTEIQATLAAVKERYPGRRILCAFHPHTFTRTIALKGAFATAFRGADQTYVMDIYGSAREQHGGITAEELAHMIAQHNPAVPSGGVAATVATLVRDARLGDVILCIGAGSNDEVARGTFAALRDRAAA
jgi:UDP-N-acetylmuramate--alanine ligase